MAFPGGVPQKIPWPVNVPVRVNLPDAARSSRVRLRARNQLIQEVGRLLSCSSMSERSRFSASTEMATSRSER